MKTEFIDVSDTRKNLVVEIPSTVVDAEIDKVARDYSRAARIPGFRPGKVPPKVVRQRFRDQILHDVAHGLIPRAVDEALRERGVEPVNTPDIRDVVVEEGQPLKFTASFETVPAIDPGDYASLTLRRKEVAVDDAAVDQALSRLQDRAARYEPVEGRGVAMGDSVVLDLKRTAAAQADEGQTPSSGETHTDRHDNVTVDIGATANPPGLRRGAHRASRPGASKTFDVHYPADYAVQELAGTTVTYDVTVKAIRKRVVPPLDDELAKDLGSFESLDALRGQVRADLEHEARHEVERETRADLLRQLASRVTFDVPSSLVDREIDRRVEEFVRRLVEQQIDPTQAPTSTGKSSASGSARPPRKPCAARSCSTRSPGATASPRPTRRWTPRSSATPSARAGRPRRCGPGSRRKADLPAFTQDCVGRRRWSFSCRKRPSSTRDESALRGLREFARVEEPERPI